jgi:hypothetical protein
MMLYLVCGKHADGQLFIVAADMPGIDSANALTWRERLAICRKAYARLAELNAWNPEEVGNRDIGFEFVFPYLAPELGGLTETLYKDGLERLEDDLRNGKLDGPEPAGKQRPESNPRWRITSRRNRPKPARKGRRQ